MRDFKEIEDKIVELEEIVDNPFCDPALRTATEYGINLLEWVLDYYEE